MSKSKAKPDSRSKTTPAPSSSHGRYMPARIELPSYYLKCLDSEVERLRYNGRAQLLEHFVLAQKKVRAIVFDAPKLRPPAPKDLEDHQVYVWNLKPETKEMLEELQLQLGRGTYKAPVRLWIIETLDKWFGWPTGIPFGPDAK